MDVVSLLLLCLCLGSVRSEIFQVKNETINMLYETEQVWILAFVRPEEQASINFTSTWQSVHDRVDTIVKVGVVDATDPGLQSWTEKMKGMNLPLVFSLPSPLTTPKAEDHKPTPYRGELNEDSLVRWAHRQVPSAFVERQKSVTDFNLWRLRIGTTNPVVGIFHNESDAPAFFRTLSLTYLDRLTFFDVRVRKGYAKQEELAAKFNVTNLPTMLLFQKEEQKETDKSALSEEPPLRWNETDWTVTNIGPIMEQYGNTIERRDEIRAARRKEREAREKSQKEAEEKAKQAKEQAELEKQLAEERKKEEARLRREARMRPFLEEAESLQVIDGEFVLVMDPDIVDKDEL